MYRFAMTPKPRRWKQCAILTLATFFTLLGLAPLRGGDVELLIPVSYARVKLSAGAPTLVTLDLPQGEYNRIYILAASADGDQKASFQVGDAKVDANIQDWTGFIGQWDTRLWKNQTERDWAISANHAAWRLAAKDKHRRVAAAVQCYQWGDVAGWTKATRRSPR